MHTPTQKVPPSCVLGLFGIFALIITLISGAASIVYISKNGFDLDDPTLTNILQFFIPALITTIIFIAAARWVHKRTNHEEYTRPNSMRDTDLF